MALFGKERDIKFFRSINKELLHDIIETYVDIFKVSLDNTITNVYGESKKKIYFEPVRLTAYIGAEDSSGEFDDFGKSKNQTIVFNFLREDLIGANLVIEEGDFLNWQNKYWEIDHTIENKFFMTRDPATNKSIGDEFGWNYSIKASAHLSRKNRTQLEQTRSGNNR